MSGSACIFATTFCVTMIPKDGIDMRSRTTAHIFTFWAVARANIPSIWRRSLRSTSHGINGPPLERNLIRMQRTMAAIQNHGNFTRASNNARRTASKWLLPAVSNPMQYNLMTFGNWICAHISGHDTLRLNYQKNCISMMRPLLTTDACTCLVAYPEHVTIICTKCGWRYQN